MVRTSASSVALLGPLEDSTRFDVVYVACATGELSHLTLVDVEAYDPKSALGESECQGKTDIAQSDYAYKCLSVFEAGPERGDGIIHLEESLFGKGVGFNGVRHRPVRSAS